MADLSEAELLAPIDGDAAADFAFPSSTTDASSDAFFDFAAAPAEPAPAVAAVDDFDFAAAVSSETAVPAPVAAGFDFEPVADPAAAAAAPLPVADFAAAPVADFAADFAAAPVAAEPAAAPAPTSAPAASASSSSSSSSAASTKSKISIYTAPAEPGLGAVDDSALIEWNRKHQAELNAKDRDSQARHKELLAEAQAQIQKFFEERKSTTAARARQNRANTATVLDSAPAADQIWDNVGSLCDLKETHRHNGADVTRMRDLLVTLKH